MILHQTLKKERRKGRKHTLSMSAEDYAEYQAYRAECKARAKAELEIN